MVGRWEDMKKCGKIVTKSQKKAITLQRLNAHVRGKSLPSPAPSPSLGGDGKKAGEGNKELIMSEKLEHTNEQFRTAIAKCRDLFSKKLHDYGAAWRIMRPSSVTDQIFIKANRIRSLEIKGEALVDEGIYPEFQGIVNYGIVALIQLELGFADKEDLTPEQAMTYYDKYAQVALDLMIRKNHDYDEAWRSMRISSYTDLILMKLYRTKEIESNDGRTIVSEGVDANYLDMINYSVFGLIKLDEGCDK